MRNPTPIPAVDDSSSSSGSSRGPEAAQNPFQALPVARTSPERTRRRVPLTKPSPGTATHHFTLIRPIPAGSIRPKVSSLPNGPVEPGHDEDGPESHDKDRQKSTVKRESTKNQLPANPAPTMVRGSASRSKSSAEIAPDLIAASRNVRFSLIAVCAIADALSYPIAGASPVTSISD